MTQLGTSPAIVPEAQRLRRDVAVAAGDPVLLDRTVRTLEAGGLTVAARAAKPADWDGAHLMNVEVAVFSADVAASAQGPELRRLKAEVGPRRVVMVTPTAGPVGVRRLLDAGLEGLVLEESLESTLVATVRAVLAGQIVVPRSAGPQLSQPALTSREKQILGMVTLGFANGEIAAKLYLAESTVKSHLSSAFAKLGVRSRSEATALILDPKGPLGPGILRISDGHTDGQRPAVSSQSSP